MKFLKVIFAFIMDKMASYGPHQKHVPHLDHLDLDRYYKKLNDYNNEPLPNPFVLHDAKYVDDVSKWPEILYGNIWEYLVQAPCVYTPGQMQAFKRLEAYNYIQVHLHQKILRQRNFSIEAKSQKG